MINSLMEMNELLEAVCKETAKLRQGGNIQKHADRIDELAGWAFGHLNAAMKTETERAKAKAKKRKSKVA